MHGCTVTTVRYLAHARVLAESFLARNPGAGFSALVIDDSPHPGAGIESFETLTPAEVGVDSRELNRRAAIYQASGLACSLKANLMLALVERGSGPVLYLDADGCVYEELSHVAELAQCHALVLTPHSLDPYPLWRVDSPEQMLVRSGVMNGGFLAAGSGGLEFLRWWAGRTARCCLLDGPRGLLLDQTWLTIAMAPFEHHVLRDRGCNVAGWNLHNRDIEWDGDVPMIDGGPLRHFHLACSYDPERPHRLTTQEHAHWWPTLDQRPGVARLSREYAKRLLAHGYRAAQAAPVRFDAMPGGTPLESHVRLIYREALVESELDGTQEPPNPFSDGDERFRDWLLRRAIEHWESSPSASETGSRRE
jgi:hypothetical protein